MSVPLSLKGPKEPGRDLFSKSAGLPTNQIPPPKDFRGILPVTSAPIVPPLFDLLLKLRRLPPFGSAPWRKGQEPHVCLWRLVSALFDVTRRFPPSKPGLTVGLRLKLPFKVVSLARGFCPALVYDPPTFPWAPPPHQPPLCGGGPQEAATNFEAHPAPRARRPFEIR